jgi:SAM-dependent methyltransferase
MQCNFHAAPLTSSIMSSYENYTATSAHYDSTREPIGIEIILGCLARGRRPLAEQILVDAGCGTGSYSLALVDRVARIEAVDMNEGMLEVARTKLADAEAAERISFHSAAIEGLPLDDASVDAVMINQVLHHLPDDGAEGWPLTRKVIGEFARVLRPGGVLVVNSCSHEQLRRGWWFFPLIEPIAERMIQRHVPLSELESMITGCGFDPGGRFVPSDAVLQGGSYLDPRGPLNATWRAGDSVWAMLSPQELARVEEGVRSMDARGELEDFVSDNDAERVHVGQTTFLRAVRR